MYPEFVSLVMNNTKGDAATAECMQVIMISEYDIINNLPVKNLMKQGPAIKVAIKQCVAGLPDFYRVCLHLDGYENHLPRRL